MSNQRERPILFSSPMVRAILSDAKVQTRRIVKPQPVDYDFGVGEPRFRPAFTEPDIIPGYKATGIEHEPCYLKKKPFIAGDHLWVREGLHRPDGDPWLYRADDLPVMVDKAEETAMLVWAHHKEQNYCPGIHAPRWASRITLEITGVRIERLNCITESDALAEGIHRFKLPNGNVYGYDPRGTPGKMVMDSATDAYAALWEKINGAGSWKINPFVWVVSFKRIDAAPNSR